MSRETRHSVEKEEGLRQVGVQREENTKLCVQLVAYGAIDRRKGFGSKRHAGEEGRWEGETRSTGWHMIDTEPARDRWVNAGRQHVDERTIRGRREGDERAMSARQDRRGGGQARAKVI